MILENDTIATTCAGAEAHYATAAFCRLGVDMFATDRLEIMALLFNSATNLRGVAARVTNSCY
jgi:hypothetical protein